MNACELAVMEGWTVRFEWNNSKQWDGKEVAVDGEWIRELYADPTELEPGKEIRLPWKGKGGTTVEWKALIVSMAASHKRDDE